MNAKKLALIIQLAFPLLYFLVSFNLPFWGDGIASVSKAAVRIYNEGLLHPWNYPDADPGHPTLFPWLIALCWNLFGQSLWVAHALIAIASALLARLLYLLSNAFAEEYRLWALILFFIAPLSVSQGILVSLQLPLTLAFFAAIWLLRKQQRIWFTIVICMLPLIHLQGVLLVGILFLFENWKSNFQRIGKIHSWIPYLFAGLVFGLWLIAHYFAMGWALFTPNYSRSAPSLGGMIYNIGISAWRIIDLGYIVLTISALVLAITKFRKRVTGDLEKLLLLSTLVLGIGIPLIFAYPPNHRYVLPVYILSIPLFLKWLMPKTIQAKTSWLSLAVIALLVGNVFYYPGKCLGDQNLVFLGYHKLEERIAQELDSGTLVYSYAPHNNADSFTYLEPRSLQHRDLYGANNDTTPIIIQSNCNCEFSAEELERLRQTHYAKSFETYGVYVNVWLHPSLVERYPELAVQEEHEPTAIETWIKRLKKSFQ